MGVQEGGNPRRRLRYLIAAGAGLVALGVAAGAWYALSSRVPRNPQSAETIHNAAPPVGKPAPDFTLPLFSGGTLALHSLRGKPVLLNFWASWCVPCRTETPLLVRLHKIYGPRGIVFVGVNVADRKTDAVAFLTQYHVDYAVVWAPDENVMDAYAIPGIPTTVFITADGLVADKFAGGFIGPAGEKSLVKRLDRLLQTAPR